MFITVISIDDGKEYKVNPNFIVAIIEKENCTAILTSALAVSGDKIASWSITVEKSREKILEMIDEVKKEENERVIKLQQINMELFYNKYMR